MKFHRKYFVVLLFMVGVVLNNAVLFNLEATEHVNERDVVNLRTILQTFTEEELQLIEAVSRGTEQTVDVAADAPDELVCCWVVSQEKGIKA